MKSARFIHLVLVVLFCLGALVPIPEAVAQDSYLLGWGWNADRQASPVPTNVLSGIESFSAGRLHSLAVRNGRVWAWGSNLSGETNVPVAAQSDVMAVAAGDGFSLALKTDGSVQAWGKPVIVTNVPSGVSSGVEQIAAGESHALALKEGGVIAWGLNSHGQCTVPAELATGVTDIGAGESYSMALKDGAVHVFGIAPGQTGEYGIRDVPPEASNDVTAISAGRWHALALRDGAVLAWGARTPSGTNSYSDATNVPPEAASGVVAISAGELFSLALKDDGTLLVWGDDTKGQQPLPAFATEDVSGISAGGGHALALCSVLPPRILGATLPQGQVGVPYSGAILATGMPTRTFYKEGAWQGWMTLDPDTGAIGGTPTAQGTFTFGVLVSNAYGTASRTNSVTILPATLLPPVLLTTNPLPAGIVGAPYSLQFDALNDPVFSLAPELGGSPLPEGLTLSPEGLLSGTPTAEYNAFFYLRATNPGGVSNRFYNITITQPAGPPEFATESPLPAGQVGQPYSVQLEASNYPEFSLLAGELPDGLGLTAAGMVTGTPTQIESALFTVEAENVMGSAQREFALDIFGPPVFITTSPLPDGEVDEPYSLQIEAEGDPIFLLVGGTLPPGLDLSAAGLLSGTPTTTGPYAFTVRATNDYGWENREFMVTVIQIPVFITTSPLPAGKVDDPYSVQIEATASPTFSLVTGSLPEGLSLAGTGLLDGTPTVSGSYAFTLRATNIYGFSDRMFDLAISSLLEPPRFTSIRSTNGHVRLDWENLNPGVDVQVWRSTNITLEPVPWSNLGIQVPPWTNTTPPAPSYYQLRLAP